ncbi:hypothetical protein [Algoriphagus boritolerans]|uniref:hypothetical protein n=1 Tax=Algoriphagus boritolerans TaxID=308111 RepID=UPI000B027D90
MIANRSIIEGMTLGPSTLIVLSTTVNEPGFSEILQPSRFVPLNSSIHSPSWEKDANEKEKKGRVI